MKAKTDQTLGQRSDEIVKALADFGLTVHFDMPGEGFSLANAAGDFIEGLNGVPAAALELVAELEGITTA